jgi:hypothetical protein
MLGGVPRRFGNYLLRAAGKLSPRSDLPTGIRHLNHTRRLPNPSFPLPESPARQVRRSRGRRPCSNLEAVAAANWVGGESDRQGSQCSTLQWHSVGVRKQPQSAMAFIRSAILIVAKLEKVSETA